MDILTMFKDSDQTETFSKGQFIFRQGSVDETIYVIIEGEVEGLMDELLMNRVS